MKPRHSRFVTWLKRLTFVAVALVTLVVLLITIEGYRAKRAWVALVATLESEGEKLDWGSLAPTAVPDEQNFLATPTLAACFGFATISETEDVNGHPVAPCRELKNRLSWANHLPALGNWREARTFPLEWWQEILRSEATNAAGLQLTYRSPDAPSPKQIATARYGVMAQAPTHAPEAAVHFADSIPAWAALREQLPGTALEDVRFLLNHDQPLLDEIREAAQRPHSQLAVMTEPDPEALMTQFATLKNLIYPFRASCYVELVDGNPARAREDFETMLALADAADSQPLLIGMLVKIAMIEQAIQPLWAGLAEHRWTDTELAAVETRLQRLNMIADMQHGFRGERSFVLASLQKSATNEESPPQTPANAMARAIKWWPNAVVYRNRMNVAQAYQALLISRLDPAGPSARLTLSTEEQERRQAFGSHSPYNIFTPMLLLAIEKALEQAAKAQATVTLARIACALERAWLADRIYPEKLDALAPRFLMQPPPDPVNKAPLRYRREANDSFVLYSVGLNGIDDGGMSQLDTDESGRDAVSDKDWVWTNRLR